MGPRLSEEPSFISLQSALPLSTPPSNHAIAARQFICPCATQSTLSPSYSGRLAWHSATACCATVRGQRPSGPDCLKRVSVKAVSVANLDRIAYRSPCTTSRRSTYPRRAYSQQSPRTWLAALIKRAVCFSTQQQPQCWFHMLFELRTRPLLQLHVECMLCPLFTFNAVSTLSFLSASPTRLVSLVDGYIRFTVYEYVDQKVSMHCDVASAWASSLSGTMKTPNPDS